MKLDKNINLILSIISVILLALFWIMYPNRLPMVFETHSYVANLNTKISTDIFDQFYLLLRTPIYNLFQFVYLNPKNFFYASIIIEICFWITAFFLLFNFSKNTFSAFMCLIIFGPLFNEVFETLTGFRFFQSLGSMGWGTANFSVRYFFGIFFLVSIYFYLKKKYFLGIIFISFSLFTHPNSGIFLIGFFILYEIYLFLIKRSNGLRVFCLISISLICFIPTIINLNNLAELSSSNNIYNFDWYNNLIRDEVDDFSVIFLFLNQPITSSIHCIFIMFTFIFYNIFERQKNYENNFLIFLILLPLIILIFFILIELTLPIFNYNFAPLLLSLQPSHKILTFSLFPLMFFWSVYLSQFLKNIAKIENFFYTLFISVLCISLFFSKFSIQKKIKYLGLISDIEINSQSYYKTLDINVQMKNNGNPILPKIFLLDGFQENKKDILKNKKIFELYKFNQILKNKPNVKFNQNYNKLSVFRDFNKLIRENLQPTSNLIIPPYLFHVRDIFPEYNIFFQEHHDGNLAMGNIKIFQEIDKRMKLLIGTNYVGLPPSQQYGLNYSYMRYLYLNRNEEDFLKIKNVYDQFNYIITESKHILNFEIIDKNDHFIIYKMN